MGVLGGNVGKWGMPPFHSREPGKRRRIRRSSKPSDSAEQTGGAGFRFPIKPAVTAGSLALTGDTIAQLRERWVKNKSLQQQQHSPAHHFKVIIYYIYIYMCMFIYMCIELILAGFDAYLWEPSKFGYYFLRLWSTSFLMCKQTISLWWFERISVSCRNVVLS